MAQTTRLASSSDSTLEDATENFAHWFRLHGRKIGLALGAVAVIAAGAWAWRSISAGKAADAERAFYQAQTPLAQNDLAGAEKSLRQVAEGYDGTPAGTQARMLLAQVLYEQGKFQPGIDALKNVDDAPAAMRDGLKALAATGYEGLGKNAEAAKLYEEAANSATIATRKTDLRASAARAYQAAGNAEAARKLWTEILTDEASPLADEARVRLGELSAKPIGG